MFPLLPFPSLREVVAFVLVLTRVAGIFAAFPVFGGQRLPLQIKVIAILMITLVCFPILSVTPPQCRPMYLPWECWCCARWRLVWPWHL